MSSQQIFTDNDIMIKLTPWIDLLSLLKCRQVNKQWFKLCSDSIINTLTTFKQYAKLYLAKHGMLDKTITQMYYQNQFKQCHTYICSAESQDEKPFLLNKTLQKYIDVRNVIITASKTDQAMNNILDSLVQEYDTFVSVTYPSENRAYGSYGTDLHSLLLEIVPSETFNQLMFGHNLDKLDLWNVLGFDDHDTHERLLEIRQAAKMVYCPLVERETMRIIFNHPRVTKYNNVNYDAAGHSNKNLLLLDWDQTLYNGETPRDGLHEFLIFACTHFCVWIETAGADRKEYIAELNKIDGINISGVISRNYAKWRLNKWILQNEWFGVNSKFENFLLIDDLFGQKISKKKFINTIVVPRIGIDESDQRSIQSLHFDFKKLVQSLDFDKNVLSKLTEWLGKWDQYTNIDKHGSTSKFIQENGLPQLKFTLYDNDRWLREEITQALFEPNYKSQHLKPNNEL